MPLFTPQNAREMHRKGLEVRRKNAALRRLTPRPSPQTPQLVIVNPVNQSQSQSDCYVGERLSRIRRHIEQVDRRFRSETDPARLSKLARALSDLAEIERKLAGRPLPGALRPRSRGGAAAPIAEPIGPASA